MIGNTIVVYDPLYDALGTAQYTRLLIEQAKLNNRFKQVVPAVPGEHGVISRKKDGLAPKLRAVFLNSLSMRRFKHNAVILNVWEYNNGELLELLCLKFISGLTLYPIFHDQRCIRKDQKISVWKKRIAHSLATRSAFISKASYHSLENSIKNAHFQKAPFIFCSPLSPRPNLNSGQKRRGTIFFGNFNKKVKFSEAQKRKIIELAAIPDFQPVIIAGSGASKLFQPSSNLSIVDKFLSDDELNLMLAEARFGVFLYREIYNSFVWSDYVYTGVVPITDRGTDYTRDLIEQDYAMDIDLLLHDHAVSLDNMATSVSTSLPEIMRVDDVQDYLENYVNV